MLLLSPFLVQLTVSFPKRKARIAKLRSLKPNTTVYSFAFQTNLKTNRLHSA
jgi:hypothetical protein